MNRKEPQHLLWTIWNLFLLCGSGMILLPVVIVGVIALGLLWLLIGLFAIALVL